MFIAACSGFTIWHHDGNDSTPHVTLHIWPQQNLFCLCCGWLFWFMCYHSWINRGTIVKIWMKMRTQLDRFFLFPPFCLMHYNYLKTICISAIWKWWFWHDARNAFHEYWHWQPVHYNSGLYHLYLFNTLRIVFSCYPWRDNYFSKKAP